jgi:hypothetical protein
VVGRRGQELDLDIFRLAGFVGLSRVPPPLAHHPSDVFASAVLGYSIAHYVVCPWLVPQIDASVPITKLSANDCLSKVSTPQTDLTYLKLLETGKITSHRFLIIDALMQIDMFHSFVMHTCSDGSGGEEPKRDSSDGL